MTEIEIILVLATFAGSVVVGYLNAACGDPLAIIRLYRP